MITPGVSAKSKYRKIPNVNGLLKGLGCGGGGVFLGVFRFTTRLQADFCELRRHGSWHRSPLMGPPSKDACTQGSRRSQGAANTLFVGGQL